MNKLKTVEARACRGLETKFGQLVKVGPLRAGGREGLAPWPRPDHGWRGGRAAAQTAPGVAPTLRLGLLHPESFTACGGA